MLTKIFYGQGVFLFFYWPHKSTQLRADYAMLLLRSFVDRPSITLDAFIFFLSAIKLLSSSLKSCDVYQTLNTKILMPHQYMAHYFTRKNKFHQKDFIKKPRHS